MRRERNDGKRNNGIMRETLHASAADSYFGQWTRFSAKEITQGVAFHCP